MRRPQDSSCKTVIPGAAEARPALSVSKERDDDKLGLSLEPLSTLTRAIDVLDAASADSRVLRMRADVAAVMPAADAFERFAWLCRQPDLGAFDLGALGVRGSVGKIDARQFRGYKEESEFVRNICISGAEVLCPQR